jgi:hypothetical protein
MSGMKSIVMDLRPAAKAAQRLFTANQIMFVIALVYGVGSGVHLVASPGNYFNTG